MTSSRERMLGRIRSGLEQARPMLTHEAGRISHIPPAYVHPAEEDLAQQFAAELRKLECNTYMYATEQAALELVSSLLERYNTQHIIAWDMAQIGLPGLEKLVAQHQIRNTSIFVGGTQRAAQLQELEPATVCITGADVAIAESASIVLRGGPGRPRLASLLAPIYIAIIRKSQLVRGLGEALMRLQSQHAEDFFRDASTLTFITGPSRTADIELTLTLGVHGPREVHAIILG